MTALAELHPLDAYAAGVFAARLERAAVAVLPVRCPEGSCMLALRLALALVSRPIPADRLAVCSGCGVTYARQKYRAMRGYRNWCSVCLKSGVPSRLNTYEWRERKRKEQER